MRKRLQVVHMVQRLKRVVFMRSSPTVLWVYSDNWSVKTITSDKTPPSIADLVTWRSSRYMTNCWEIPQFVRLLDLTTIALAVKPSLFHKVKNVNKLPISHKLYMVSFAFIKVFSPGSSTFVIYFIFRFWIVNKIFNSQFHSLFWQFDI